MAGKYSRFFRSGFIAVIAAVFQLQLFAFSVQVNQTGSVNGTVSLTSASVGGTSVSTYLSSGQSATIKAVPNNGYQFQAWTISVATTAGKSYSLSSNTADYQIKYDDFTSSYGSILIVQCTAIFKAKAIKVNFDANNINAAVSPTSSSQTFGSNYANLPTPTAIGLSFVGWFTKSEGGEEVTSETLVTEPNEHTLYAHWQALSYNLVFDPSGGTLSGSSSLTVIYGGVYPDLSTASRTGYDFQGWYTGENGTGSQIKKGGEVVILNDSTLYAYWSPQNYTVSFDANGGSVTTTSKSVTYNSTYGDLPTPTRAGYSFNGWYTETSGGTQITSTTKVQITLAQTLYARWAAKTYTVTLSANGGSVDPTSKSVTYDSTYGDFPTPTRAGYTFKGWFTAASGGTPVTSTTKVQITDAQTLYAQWTANKYTVEYDANGGNVGTSSKQVTYDATYGALSTPTRTGYTFKGWFTAPSGGTQITASTKVSIVETQILYAQWSVNEYNVQFDANGGVVTPSSLSVTYNSTYGSLPTPTRTGYTFKGWYTATSGGTQVTSTTKVQITAEQILYARWAANTYTVTFNASSGSVDIASKSVTYDSTYGDLPTPTRTGYTFKGWYTAASSGDKIISTTKVQITSAQTLYAQWTAKTFTITFNVNGGSCDTPSKSVTYDLTYGDLPTATRTEHAFNGWFTEASGGVEITASTIVQITEDQTLYAQWSKSSYTVSFDRAGGEFVGDGSPISVKNGETYPALPEVTRVGYGFAGWYLHGDIEIKEGDTVTITSNSWAYAVWTNNIYTVIFRKGEAFYGEEFSTNVFYDIPFKLPTNSFECLDGSTFAGWKLPDGKVQAAETDALNLAASGSVEVVATWSKPEDPLNASGICKNLFVTTSSGDQAWTVYEQDGVKCLKSGNVKGNDLYSKLESKLIGESGTIMFKWCYVGDAGLSKAFLTGNSINTIKINKGEHAEGFGNWKEVVYTITKEEFDRVNGCITWQVNPAIGKYAQQTHTLYIKDVVWIPDGYQSESEEFTYTDEMGVARTASVPTSWVDENSLLPSGSTDYRAALEALSGKKDSSGAPLSYWHDYVAGTDPKNPADVFKVTAITITNGTVYLSWSPDLRSAPQPREYQILGKEKLTDPTWAPTNSASRFFRVDVHLKE